MRALDSFVAFVSKVVHRVSPDRFSIEGAPLADVVREVVDLISGSHPGSELGRWETHIPDPADPYDLGVPTRVQSIEELGVGEMIISAHLHEDRQRGSGPDFTLAGGDLKVVATSSGIRDELTTQLEQLVALWTDGSRVAEASVAFSRGNRPWVVVSKGDEFDVLSSRHSRELCPDPLAVAKVLRDMITARLSRDEDVG